MLSILITLQQLEKLVGKQFNEKGMQNNTMLVLYSQQNCEKCNLLTDKLEQACEQLKYIADCYIVDCSVKDNSKLCEKQNISAFPLLKIYNHNEGAKAQIYRGYQNKQSIIQFVSKLHRKPFVHFQDDNTATDLIKKNANKATLLVILTPSPKPSSLAYKLARELKPKQASLLLQTSYNSDIYYKYKGCDLVDYIQKDGLQVVFIKQGKYIVYKGENNEKSIEQWVQKQI